MYMGRGRRGTLDVADNGDLLVVLRRELPDEVEHRLVLLVLAMGEVEAHHVHPREDHLLQYFAAKD